MVQDILLQHGKCFGQSLVMWQWSLKVSCYMTLDKTSCRYKLLCSGRRHWSGMSLVPNKPLLPFKAVIYAKFLDNPSLSRTSRNLKESIHY